MWDCRDVPVYWVSTRHMSSFCCFPFPSIFPVVPTAAALTPLQNFRQAHLLLPVCALLSAKKRHGNIDSKSLMKSSQAVLRKSCDRLFLPGFRKSTYELWVTMQPASYESLLGLKFRSQYIMPKGCARVSVGLVPMRQHPDYSRPLLQRCLSLCLPPFTQSCPKQ